MLPQSFMKAFCRTALTRSAVSPNFIAKRQFADKVSEETPLTETVRHFLDPADFIEMLAKNDIDFYTGVPDSLLKDVCAYIQDNVAADKHVIAANEGSSVALAAGYHLATQKNPLVYMQNSGFGNAVNPLLSLAHPNVYSVPMLLLIGWRGEPGKKDEPQHMVQGKVMTALLADMGIPFEILPDFKEGAEETIATAAHYLKTRKGPYALLVKKQNFSPYKLKSTTPNEQELSREQAIELIIESLGERDAIVSTTGFTSRELYEIRAANKQGHHREFLTVGSMGHASSIALGIAMAQPERQVVTLDGDGALLMHMGALTSVGNSGCKNFKHILLNNGAHDSVGGQPSLGFNVDWVSIAKSSGYPHSFTATSPEEIKAGMKKLNELEGPVFFEIKVNKGARKNLGRPKSSPVQNKADLMEFLQK